MKLLPERESNTLIVLSVGLCVCVWGGGSFGFRITDFHKTNL